jgi:acyl dehydratase
MKDAYLEDYVPGAVYEFGSETVAEDELLEFARRYDPQYIHTDRAAAEAGPFKGLIASGWQTAGFTMRMMVDHYISHVATMASPGLDELRWHKPVRPGDTLRVRIRVLESRRSESKPDRGVVKSFVETLNQHGEVVMSFTAIGIFAAKPA